jgi:tetratricopeptide (TPR) repeat protein
MRIRSIHFLFLALLQICGLSGCSQGPVEWWNSVNGKAHDLGMLSANYQALQIEHERLKKDYFRLESEAMDMRAKLESNEKGERNLTATGSLEGRTLSSIAYDVPKGLRIDDELSLAFEHFTEQRFAESAATFEDTFQRPDAKGVADAYAHFTAGVAWYQLGNYFRARKHFEEAGNEASGEQRERIQKKVELWLRAIDRKKRG